MKPLRGILLGITGSLLLAAPCTLSADSGCRDNAQARSLRLQSATQAQQSVQQAGKIVPRTLHCDRMDRYCRNEQPATVLNRSEQISHLGRLIRARRAADASDT